jgi:hypothetical protein
MAMMRAAATLLAVALATSVSIHGQAGSLLAVDQGTHLQPIARLEGATWVAVPAAGLGRLAPRDWIRWYSQGSSVPIQLSVREPTGRCAAPRRLSIARPPAAPQGLVDPTYVGIAVTGTAAVEPLRRIGEGAPEWAQIVSEAGHAFARREGDYGVATTTLARVPLTVDRAYAAGGDRRTSTYYFEASKRVHDAGNTPEEDPKGVVRVMVSGWLVAARDRLAPAGTRGELLWEQANVSEADVVPVLTPLGVLRQGNERLWVMKADRGSGDRFTVYALGSASVRTLLSVDSGAC